MSPGAVTDVPTLDFDRRCDFQAYGAKCADGVWFTTAGRPTVTRSPATSGTQLIAWVYSMQKRESGGEWREFNRQQKRTGQIPAGQQEFQLTQFILGPMTGRLYGDWQLLLAIAWSDEAGNSLGSAAVYNDRAADFRCYAATAPEDSNKMSCDPMDGFLRLGPRR